MANLDALDAQLDALQSEHEPEGGWLGSLAIVLDGINEAGKHDEADKRRIARMVDRFREAVDNVAKKTGAHGYSVSISYPLGVNVSLDWKTDDD